MWVVQQNPWSCISQNWHRTCVPSHERTLVLHCHVQKIVSRSLSREQQLLTGITRWLSVHVLDKKESLQQNISMAKRVCGRLLICSVFFETNPVPFCCVITKHTWSKAYTVRCHTCCLRDQEATNPHWHSDCNMETKCAMKRVPRISWAGVFQANSWLRPGAGTFPANSWLRPGAGTFPANSWLRPAVLLLLGRLASTDCDQCCPWQRVLAYSGCDLPLFPQVLLACHFLLLRGFHLKAFLTRLANGFLCVQTAPVFFLSWLWWVPGQFCLLFLIGKLVM